jgi:hypothetical protein
MSDVVNDQDIRGLAAEFVLGTLDSDERARANELLESDSHFRDMVRVWERRLGELHLMVEPVDPPAPIWDRIKTKFESVEQEAAVSQQDAEVSQPEVPDVSEVSPADTMATITTLEALEAELREEGLAPAQVSPIEAPAPAIEPTPLAPTHDGGEPMPVPERQDQATVPASASAGRGWRLYASLMTLVAIALAGLIAAWRYIPDRLPPQLRAVQVLNIHIPEPPPVPTRPPAPPESQFNE